MIKNLLNRIEDRDDLTYSKVAEFIGGSEACISKLKKEGVMGFRKLLRMSILLFPFDYNKTMTELCSKLKTVENIKHSFEYASITRNKELLNQVIMANKNEKGIIGEYVVVYSILFKFYSNEINANELVTHLKDLPRLKDKPLNVLVKIIECYHLYYKGSFYGMLEKAQEAQELLFTLNKNDLFLKECYLHKIAEVLSPVHLHLNNLELARHYALIIINANICPKKVSDASYIVGMSFLTEDEDACIKYLQKSYDISKTIGEKDIEAEARRNLDFAKIFLGEPLDKDSDPTLINYQNNSDCGIIEKGATFQEGDDDFLVLFDACSCKSEKKLHGLYENFINDFNLFFASLTAIEIQKTSEGSLLLDFLVKLKIKTKGDVYFEKNYISCFSGNNFSDGSYCA